MSMAIQCQNDEFLHSLMFHLRSRPPLSIKGAECANAVTCFEIVHPNHNNDTCCANRFRDETDAQPMPWLKFSNSVALQAGPAFLPSDNKDISIEHVAYLTSAPMIHA